MDDTARLADVEAPPCQPCAHSAEHGWWGKGTLPDDSYTHCRDCHVSFPSTQKWGHCAACCTTFSGLRAFDDHHKAKECPLGEQLHGSEATWAGSRYVVKLHEKGGFLYWGSAEQLDPKVFS